MLRDAATALYSATDLINLLGCAHCTALDLRCLRAQLAPPRVTDDPYLALLADKGIEHERRYLEQFRSEGRSVRAIAHDLPRDVMAEETRQALRTGVDVIYQGALVAPPTTTVSWPVAIISWLPTACRSTEQVRHVNTLCWMSAVSHATA